MRSWIIGAAGAIVIGCGSPAAPPSELASAAPSAAPPSAAPPVSAAAAASDVGLGSPPGTYETRELVEEALLDVIAVAARNVERCEGQRDAEAIAGPSPFEGTPIAAWPGLRSATATCMWWRGEEGVGSANGPSFEGLNPGRGPWTTLAGGYALDDFDLGRGGPDERCGRVTDHLCAEYLIAEGDPAAVELRAERRTTDGGWIRVEVEARRRR